MVVHVLGCSEERQDLIGTFDKYLPCGAPNMQLRAESLVLTRINAHPFDCFTRLHDASRARMEDELVDDDSLYEQGSHHSAFIASDCMSRATDIALVVFSDLLDPVMAAVDGTLVIAAVFGNWRVVIKLKFLL